MGVIKRGLLGGFSGRIGNIVGSSWKGIAVIKSLPLSVANPRTAKQTTQRTAFKETGEFAKKILGGWIKPLWDRFASQMSGYNAFMKVNVPLYNQENDYPTNAFLMSRGKMKATDFTFTAPTNGGVAFDIEWTEVGDSGLQLASDIIYVMIYNDNEMSNVKVASGALRNDGTITVEVDEAVATGEHYSIYLAAKRADGTIVSDSVHHTYTIQ